VVVLIFIYLCFIYLLTFPDFYERITDMSINDDYNFTCLSRRETHALCRTADKTGSLQSNSKIERCILIGHGIGGNGIDGAAQSRKER
jgi:hypothetical protein